MELPAGDDLRKQVAMLERKLRHSEQAREHLEELNDRNQHILRQSNAELAEANAELQVALARLMAAQARLVQAEKLASLGQLVAGVAHEINNPLNFICSAVPSLRRDLAKLRSALPSDGGDQKIAARIDKLVDAIAMGADRSADIVKGLRLFSRLDKAVLEPADLRESLATTLMLLRHQLGERITLVERHAELPRVQCYAGQVNQVFMNLLVNAIQAIEGEGTIHVTTRQLDPEWVEIEIRDTGVGMSAEVLERACDPFFTTKDVGTGTGLGLSIVHGIIERHGGSLVIESELGRGTSMRVRLPIAGPPPDSDEQREQ